METQTRIKEKKTHRMKWSWAPETIKNSNHFLWNLGSKSVRDAENEDGYSEANCWSSGEELGRQFGTAVKNLK
jgi:hypothetical protein